MAKGMKLDEIGSCPPNLRGKNEQKTDLKPHQIDYQKQCKVLTALIGTTEAWNTSLILDLSKMLGQ